MASAVVYSSTTGADALEGQLFNGMKFWLSAKVPQRSRFINDIKANGGEICQLEKTADVKIADHARKEALPGTFSYTFIEKSIRNGSLEDLANHAVGPAPGAIRHVGSVTQPAKLTRQKYTAEDERILWDWVKANPQRGGGTDGNEIYKQLEMEHSQHPWQSWRDHYIKSMKGRANLVYPPNNGPPTPPSENPATESSSGTRADADGKDTEGEFDNFTDEDEDALMEEGHQILNIPQENVAKAWRSWAKVEKKHTAEEWRAFWERKVRPKFLEKEAIKAKRAVNVKKTLSKEHVPDMQPSNLTQSQAKTRDVDASSQKGSKKDTQPPMLGSTTPRTRPRPMMQTDGAAATNNLPEETFSPLGTSILKRKRPVVEELPSSSPPQITLTPSARKKTTKAKEIASTPDQSPRRYDEETQQPLPMGEAHQNTQEAGVGSSLGRQPSESLSEPDRSARTSTQALLRAPTPHIDLEIALPEGGWGGDEDADHADKSASESEQDSAPDQLFVHDTQAILNSKTQIPDLFVPNPDDPWDSLIPPSSPPLMMPSSPAATSESSSAQQARLDEEIDALLANRMKEGFSAEQIIMVLDSTCTNIPLTEQVLKQMGPQTGSIKLPHNIKGVWTADDDRDLQSSDARMVGRLDPKHGADNVNARYQWLQLMGPEG